MRSSCTRRVPLVAVALVLLGARLAYAIPVMGNLGWQDTGIALGGGGQYQVEASGWVASDLALNPSSYHDPDGVGQDGNGPYPNAPVDFLAPGLVQWSLVGRVSAGGTPFQLGGDIIFTAPASGNLGLAFNDNYYDDNSGAYEVTVNLVPEPATFGLLALGGLALVRRRRKT